MRQNEYLSDNLAVVRHDGTLDIPLLVDVMTSPSTLLIQTRVQTKALIRSRRVMLYYVLGHLLMIWRNLERTYFGPKSETSTYFSFSLSTRWSQEPYISITFSSATNFSHPHFILFQLFFSLSLSLSLSFSTEELIFFSLSQYIL